MSSRSTRSLALASALLLAAGLLLPPYPAAAASPPCQPCAGIHLADPASLLDLLDAEPVLESGEQLYIAFSTELDGSADPGQPTALAAAGATPWQRLVFRAAPPLIGNVDIESELADVARLARAATPSSHFEVVWQPAGETPALEVPEYAFLLKRASVTIKGAQPEARVIAAPPSTDPGWLEALMADDIGAYIEGWAVSAVSSDPATGAADVAPTVETLAILDPGRPLALGGLAYPAEPMETLAEAARWTAAGFSVTLFDLADPGPEAIAPLKLLAREFKGDLALDPYSEPTGDLEGWAFVRGEDLGLRVIIKPTTKTDELVATFSDSGLRNPSRVDPATGEAVRLYGVQQTSDGLEVRVADPGATAVLHLERLTASEIEGIAGLEEKVLVTTERQLPVEEILRRLQAFEDAQTRRLRTYRAINTTHLRYQIGTGGQSIETSFKGPFFFLQDGGFDWVWQEFLINGVRWRSNKIPEIPLIQPEKATVAPIDISFTREYRYELQGTETVGERDCWVVDFEPLQAVEPGSSLYRGTVWVDREIFARVQTRAVQLGLEGDVLSNDETITFGPVDADGQPVDWTADGYFLPLRLVGQQLWTILSATTVVEREVLLTEIAINTPDFDKRRETALASEYTMVRDTDEGLRYLVKDEESGERVVKEGIDTSRRFIVGGVFHDEALDFPLPLGGYNWLWFDWRGTGTQANIFFAGPLITIAATKPGFRGSKFDLGLDVFALAVAGTDRVFRNGVEIDAEDVERINPNLDLKLGRQLGQFGKFDLRYQLGFANFSRASDTAEDFVLPSDHLNHTLSLTTRYNRKGYRLQGNVSRTQRGEWDPWGLPGNDDFDPEDDVYTRWGVSAGKIWHLPKFFKFGTQVEYVNGSHLDRFSKYEFGYFSDIRVRGYQSDKVRAEEAYAAHLTYGLGIGEVFRVDLAGDAAWVTDEQAGFDGELLAGAGVGGTFIGPWSTVITADLGVAVTGPDDGFTAFLAVLKPLK
ncbi:MAG: outer membrane lipoprotein-sorting protein [Acidobacteriota bacterium]|nr:outer membrane lipoprotein-sorting protein [Acidobacteriota bacterium]